MGFRTSTCAGLSIHAQLTPPHFQGSVGGGTSYAQRTSWMLPKKPSKLGFFIVRIHRLPPNLLPVRGLGLRPQFPPPKDRLLTSHSSEYHAAGGPPGAFRGPPEGFQGPPPARGLQGRFTSTLHSIGSSHCLTQYADVYLQCLTTLVMGGI